jgi:hypothetical protein
MGRSLLGLGNKLPLEHSELYVFHIYVENTVVTSKSLYNFKIICALHENFWTASRQPPSSRLGAKIGRSFPVTTFLRPGNPVRHGPKVLTICFGFTAGLWQWAFFQHSPLVEKWCLTLNIFPHCKISHSSKQALLSFLTNTFDITFYWVQILPWPLNA